MIVDLIIDKRNSLKNFAMNLMCNYKGILLDAKSDDVVDRKGIKVYEVYVVSFFITKKNMEKFISDYNIKQCNNGDYIM